LLSFVLDQTPPARFSASAGAVTLIDQGFTVACAAGRIGWTGESQTRVRWVG
jgi:hypothetical protein